jgi:HEAT repeat protein
MSSLLGFAGPGGRLGCAACLMLAMAATVRAQIPDNDSPLATEPNIPVAKVVKVFPERLLALWLQALERPEIELKCQAAATLALAQRRGMAGLEKAVPALLRAVDQADQDANVRLTAAQALLALDARPAAPNLLARARIDGVDMRNVVEPALARWKFAPAGAVWLARLSESAPSENALVLAIRGLHDLREEKAIPRLKELALGGDLHSVIRVEAARALGDWQTTGLDKDAERLLATKGAPGALNRLVAAWLLTKQQSREARGMLQKLALTAEPAAAVVAINGLLDSDPASVLPRALQSPAAAVRARGVEAFRRRPQAEFLRPLARLLDDPHPDVRLSARQALIEAARKPELGATVRQLATQELAGQSWRALEQAAIMLASLEHKAAATRLVELLSFERPEVFVAAAWGLRKLAVAATLPAQLKELDRRFKQPLIEDPAKKALVDKGLAQLCISLGQAKYIAAAKSLGQFIPKQVLIAFGPQSRVAAIWALGLLFEKSPPEILTSALLGRLGDDSMVMPEDMGVRRMCAISLGRMKVKAATEDLEKYYPKVLSVDAFPNACGWALEQLGAARLPASGTAQVVQKGWFLESLE